MMKPKVVLLIFVSGKIVLTGAKVREEIYMAFNQIYSVLVGKSMLLSSLFPYTSYLMLLYHCYFMASIVKLTISEFRKEA